MTITNFEYDKWNKWSNKSKSTKFDEGNQIHGEKKLGKEFDVKYRMRDSKAQSDGLDLHD